MSDKPEDKTEKKVDNDAINFKNAAINKIKNLQAALDKQKSKKKNPPVVAATKLRGMRSFGENTKASKRNASSKRNA